MVFAGCIAFGAVVSRLPFLTEPNGNMAVLPHNMLPFELMYVLVITSVPAALFALLTRWLVAVTSANLGK